MRHPIVFGIERKDTQNNPTFIRERSHYRRSGLDLWTRISLGGRTDLHMIRNVTLMVRSYKVDILRPCAVFYVAAIGDLFLSMHNARRYRARRVENIFKIEAITHME